MPQSLVNNVHHTVFSTKDRMKMVEDEWSQELYRYIGGSLNRIGCRLICAGGISDHVHLLSSIDKKMGVSDFVMKVKSSSSSWIHKNIPGRTKFAWQRGYASFSVSESRIEGVTKYIQTVSGARCRSPQAIEWQAFSLHHGWRLVAAFI